MAPCGQGRGGRSQGGRRAPRTPDARRSARHCRRGTGGGIRRRGAAVVRGEVAGGDGARGDGGEREMTIRVLDPRVDPDQEPLALAPTVASLDGATIGLLDNTKIGTTRFYDHLEELLRRHGVREVVRRRKPDASRPVPPEMLDDFVTADAIVSGIGD